MKQSKAIQLRVKKAEKCDSSQYMKRTTQNHKESKPTQKKVNQGNTNTNACKESKTMQGNLRQQRHVKNDKECKETPKCKRA